MLATQGFRFATDETWHFEGVGGAGKPKSEGCGCGGKCGGSCGGKFGGGGCCGGCGGGAKARSSGFRISDYEGQAPAGGGGGMAMALGGPGLGGGDGAGGGGACPPQCLQLLPLVEAECCSTNPPFSSAKCLDLAHIYAECARAFEARCPDPQCKPTICPAECLRIGVEAAKEGKKGCSSKYFDLAHEYAECIRAFHAEDAPCPDLPPCATCAPYKDDCAECVRQLNNIIAAIARQPNWSQEMAYLCERQRKRCEAKCKLYDMCRAEEREFADDMAEFDRQFPRIDVPDCNDSHALSLRLSLVAYIPHGGPANVTWSANAFPPNPLGDAGIRSLLASHDFRYITDSIISVRCEHGRYDSGSQQIGRYMGYSKLPMVPASWWPQGESGRMSDSAGECDLNGQMRSGGGCFCAGQGTSFRVDPSGNAFLGLTEPFYDPLTFPLPDPSGLFTPGGGRVPWFHHLLGARICCDGQFTAAFAFTEFPGHDAYLDDERISRYDPWQTPGIWQQQLFWGLSGDSPLADGIQIDGNIMTGQRTISTIPR